MADSALQIVTTVRPGRAHIVPAVIVACLLAACAIALLPLAATPLPNIPGFLPAFGGTTFTIDLITAMLLLGQARMAGDAATLRLGTAYLFSALIILPHMAAFPLALMDQPLLGTSASAVWLWVFWHVGFALLIVWYAVLPRATPMHAPLSFRIGIVVAAAATLAAFAAAGVPLLPALLYGNAYSRLNTLGIGPFVLACNAVALGLVVWRLRFGTIMALWLAVAMLAACLDVAMTLTGLARFSLGWYLGRIGSLLTGLCVLTALLGELLHLYGRIGAANRYLERLATTDGLTLIPNRRAFDTTLDIEWRRAVRDSTELSLLLLDIDWFKGFNDRYGHLAGDEALRAVAGAVQRALLRPADFAARYGGEELAVILPGTDALGAANIAERLRAAIAATEIPHERSTFGRLTVSVGAATARPRHGGNAEELIAECDKALYRAKEDGRNRVRLPEAHADLARHEAALDLAAHG